MKPESGMRRAAYVLLLYIAWSVCYVMLCYVTEWNGRDCWIGLDWIGVDWISLRWTGRLTFIQKRDLTLSSFFLLPYLTVQTMLWGGGWRGFPWVLGKSCPGYRRALVTVLQSRRCSLV